MAGVRVVNVRQKVARSAAFPVAFTAYMKLARIVVLAFALLTDCSLAARSFPCSMTPTGLAEACGVGFDVPATLGAIEPKLEPTAVAVS